MQYVILLISLLVASPVLSQQRIPSHCVALALGDPGPEQLIQAAFRDPVPEESVRISYLDHAMFMLQTPGGLSHQWQIADLQRDDPARVK